MVRENGRSHRLKIKHCRAARRIRHTVISGIAKQELWSVFGYRMEQNLKMDADQSRAKFGHEQSAFRRNEEVTDTATSENDIN